MPPHPSRRCGAPPHTHRQPQLGRVFARICSSLRWIYNKGLANHKLHIKQNESSQGLLSRFLTLLCSRKRIHSTQAMSQRGWVTELPDGRYQYQERTNDKPMSDPYTETPNPA